MELHEWLALYVRHRDAYAKKLEHVEEAGEKTIFRFSDRTIEGYAYEDLRLPPRTEHVLVATLQKKENVRFLLDNWDAFSGHPGLTVIFANPARNEKWIVRPHAHARIAENVEAGIWSMAESVTFV